MNLLFLFMKIVNGQIRQSGQILSCALFWLCGWFSEASRSLLTQLISHVEKYQY